MSAVSRLGDSSTHGGSIISASTNKKANSKGIARQGDQFQCPTHGLQTLNAITTKTFVDGRLVITVGAHVTCGATITQGSPNVNAE